MKKLDIKVKYWYKTYIEECPVCGRSDQYKERQYTEKPEDYLDRVKVYQRYDYCEE
jgi:hypothetical protein